MSNKHIGELVLSQRQIQQGVSKVAEQLNQKYQGESAIIISVVPGGILFTADLVRELSFDIGMDTISCPHTPGDSNNNSTIVFHQNITIENQHVIVVDDAIESGGTMKRLVSYLSESYSLKSISIATLFVKPGRVDIPVTQHYAYEMPNNDMLIGYGLPWNNLHRNIPYLSKLVK
ncbi:MULTISPECIES: phosphoribosyltransferase [unclassified Agarivorans]|uniref:phosphoribosyltransferase n=1 Tax=unclassified Agarivorans TaxID=2636026 RepID=UPI0026E463AE|nr:MULTISPECIES: phosphoribosyltransferase family protein [unclassified Agarivorans]MDO6687091.1 phosphoribosyltransferase family protein [Agarivorans sp. 3_MG-2023]MDO6713497.1 phosphoribosyltransferase family protein [Agarivorans sp. 2_MG-2023]